MTSTPSVEQIRQWPATVPLWPEGASVFDVSRTTAYDLARRGEFPVRVLPLGRLLRVCTADLLAAVGASSRNDEAPDACEAMTGASVSDVTRLTVQEATRAAER